MQKKLRLTVCYVQNLYIQGWHFFGIWRKKAHICQCICELDKPLRYRNLLRVSVSIIYWYISEKLSIKTVVIRIKWAMRRRQAKSMMTLQITWREKFKYLGHFRSAIGWMTRTGMWLKIVLIVWNIRLVHAWKVLMAKLRTWCKNTGYISCMDISKMQLSMIV